jgi:hypothetical protein
MRPRSAGVCAVSDEVLRTLPPDLQKIQSPADCPGRWPDKTYAAQGVQSARRMLRYLFTFSFVLLLGIVACAAAIAADAPAFGQIAFAVALGLFVAALAGGVTDRRPRRSK